MARKPVGVYTRNTPDWFLYNTAAGSGSDQGTPGSSSYGVGLYNNATDGSNLVVYGIGAEAFTNEEVRFSFFSGPLTALWDDSFGSPATFSIDSAGAQPWGQIFVGLTTDQVAAPGWVQELVLYRLGGAPPSSDAEQYRWIMSSNPLAIVRAGYSFAAWTVTLGCEASFYYVVLKSL